jgi:hypothetical protein
LTLSLERLSSTDFLIAASSGDVAIVFVLAVIVLVFAGAGFAGFGGGGGGGASLPHAEKAAMAENNIPTARLPRNNRNFI